MSMQDLSTTTSAQSLSRDLWSKALRILDDEIKDGLDLNKATYGDVLGRALEEAQKRRNLCIQKRWKLKNHRGQTIILRDVVEKIIVWVEKFIAVGDVAMQYDTVHAAPAWAAFRFVLQMSINYHRVFVGIIQNLEIVSHLIARYALLEQLYLQRNSTARDKLQEMIIRLYAEILTFLAKASKYFRKTKRERIVGSIFKFSEDEQMNKIVNLDDQISKLTEVFIIDLQIDLTNTQIEVSNKITAMNSFLTSFDEPIKRLVAESNHSANLTVHERVIEEYKRQQAVARVDGFEIPKLQVADCTRLILETTAYNPAMIVVDAVDEIPPSCRHVLLSAFAGIVKDSASVVKIFVTSRDDSNVRALIPDAMSVRVQDQYTRVDMENFVQREVSSAIQNCRLLNGDVSDDLREEVIEAMISGAGEMFIWVVRQIENLSQRSSETDVRNALRQIPGSTLDGLYEESFSRISKAGQYAQDCATKIFRLLLCTQEPLSPEAVIQAIDTGSPQRGEPMDLSKMIHICCNFIVLDTELKILRFVHVSFQEFLQTKADFAPQSTHRAVALSCLDLCLQGSPQGMENGLSPKENFHHYSAIYWAEHCRLTGINGGDDFLTSRMHEFVFDEGDVSLCFLDWIENVNKFAKFLPRDHPLAKSLNSITQSTDGPLFTACAFGLPTVVDRLAYTERFDWHRKNDLGYSALYLAAAAGHKEITERLLQKAVDVDTLGGRFSHPLHAACFSGHIKVVELLLDHGANPKLGPKTALEYAILADHENIALLLLQVKFDVSDQEQYDAILQQAAEAGFVDVVQHLQKEYASLYGTLGSPKCKALEVALFKGRTVLIQRQIERLSDPSKDMPKDSIATAALGGHEALISLLVGKGMELNQEGRYGTALRAACVMGHESTVRQLLDLGARLDASSSLGDPLQAAAMRGHESITKMLLSHGASVNNKSGLYGTALQAAAHRGHQRVVEILLDAGADVYRDGFACDAFHAASEGGHETIVRLLLEKGFRVQPPLPKTSYSMMPTEIQSRNLLRDASPSRKREGIADREGNQKLDDWSDRASITDVADILRSLTGNQIHKPRAIQSYRERPSYSYYSSNEKEYALRAAAAKGHGKVVELLLSRSGQLCLSESEIVAAFKEACANDHAEVAGQFLSAQLKAEDLRDAVRDAAFRGCLAVVKLLADHEANVRMTSMSISPDEEASSLSSGSSDKSEPLKTSEVDSTASIILTEACKGNHLSIFRWGQELLARRCTLKAETSRHFYGNLLVYAAEHQNMDILEAMLADILEFRLEDFERALNVVCTWENESTLYLLLKHDTAQLLGGRQYKSGLKQAVRKNNPQSVLYYLEHHPDPQTRIVEPETVIDASGNGFMDVLHLLIERLKPTDASQRTLNQSLQAASSMGHKSVVEYLIGEGADVNGVEEEVHCAGEDKDSFHNKFIFGERSPRRVTALQAALIGYHHSDRMDASGRPRLLGPRWVGADRSSREETIELLVAKGADVGLTAADELHPLQCAASYCTPGILKALLVSAAKTKEATQQHATALQAAASRNVNSAEIIKSLLEGYAAVYMTDEVKAAVLHKALSFFDENPYYASFDGNPYYGHGSFSPSTSIAEVLHSGQGATVITLLSSLSDQRADDPRYCHLFQMACMAGNREYVDLLIQRGINVNGSGNYYGTALQAASRVGNIEIVERLLDAGADVNILQGAHDTAIRAASLGGHEDVVRKLVDCGADVNLCCGDKPILHLALKSGSQVIFQSLLAAGADIDVVTPDQQHIMIATCQHGDAALVKLLLERGADCNLLGFQPRGYGFMPEESATPLLAACVRGHVSLVQLLLAHRADVEKTNESSATPLLAAIREDHLSVVRLLLDAGADVDHAVDDKTPLSRAASDGKLEIMEELLEKGANIGGGSTRRNALVRACDKRQLAAIELLLETLSGTDSEAEICSDAIPAAMEARDADTVRLLLEHGVPPSRELLRQGCAFGALEAVRLLVGTGIDVNGDDGTDEPLLHLAACRSQLAIVQFLIGYGADVNLQSPKYGSPIMSALEGYAAPFLRAHSQPESCRSLAEQLPLPGPVIDYIDLDITEAQQKPGYNKFMECEQITRSLLDAGAKVDTTVRTFGLLLHLALYMGSEFIVRQLLEKITDVNVFGGYFESPLFAALKGKRPAIVELLLDRNIDVNRYSPEHGFALHSACRSGSISVIQMLLDHGADMNAYDERHGSALAAAFYGTGYRRTGYRSSRSFEELRSITDIFFRQGSKIQIQECDLLAATSLQSPEELDYFLTVFLEHDKSAVATETVILRAIRNEFGLRTESSILPRLLGRDNGLGTTPDMLESAAKNRNSFQLLKLLLEHDSTVNVTDTTIIAVLGNRPRYNCDERVLKLLLDQQPSLEISDEMLEAVEEPNDMVLLLQRRSRRRQIKSTVLEKAAGRSGVGKALVALLLEYDKSAKITPPVVTAAVTAAVTSWYHQPGSFVKILLEHDPSIEVTPEDFLSLMSSTCIVDVVEREVIQVLVDYGKTVEFTAELEEALQRRYQRQSEKEMKELFYRVRKAQI
ncbi:MAG: hypothetical protein LQ338_002155 [Usnochroma carphineum]|nr:MAG: hypothetical protein LQ338_002155 [Usnochroma carphineum]